MNNANSSKPFATLLSPKQQAAVDFASIPTYTLLMGSTQSGKTHTQRWQVLMYLLLEAEPGIAGLLTGVKLDSLKRNFLRKFEEFVSLTPFKDDFQFKSQPLEVHYLPKKVVLYAEGINEEKSESKFRGLPIQVWVGDEVPLYPRKDVVHLQARMSQGKRRAFLTGNPESKAHWMYREIIQGDNPEWKVINFGLDDNPTLSEEYKQTIKTAFVGAEYKRFVLGEWAGDPDRMVIPEFGENRDAIIEDHPTPRCFRPIIGLDVGSRDLTFAVFGYYDFAQDLIIVQDELILKNPTTQEIAEGMTSIEKALWPGMEPRRWSDVDLRLIEDFGKIHKLHMTATRKDQKEAQINQVRVLVQNRKLKIARKCTNLIRHVEGATWNERKTDYERTDGEGHFDGLDALIYFVRNIDRGNPFPPGWVDAQGRGEFISPRTLKVDEEQRQWGSMIPRRKYLGSTP